MGKQRIRGNQNVQIQEVEDSWIQIIYDSARHVLPLESAEIPISSERPSPARLVNARAGVFGYVGRGELLGELETWIDSPTPFATYLVAGRGGSGKTRLAVELCRRLREWDWLCGFLARGDGEGRLDALIEAPTPRLVVIDYAENRAEQLELLLPQLSASADDQRPVRVLLLVRTGTERAEDAPKRLRARVQPVKRVIEGCEVRVLEEDREMLSPEERAQLFADAAVALGDYAKPFSSASEPPDLDQEVFENPLMVVIAAYLAAQGEQAPATRDELLDGVLEHEHDYWWESASGLDADEDLLDRAVAVATLLRAEGEAQGSEHLRLLPDLVDANAERRNSIARWVRDRYPGPRWWNPLEPDLVGEYLVARCLTDQSVVLRGALAAEAPEGLTRPLEVLARAAADHPELAEVLGPILSKELQRLCRIAVAQARSAKDRDLLYGNVVTVAVALEALIAVVVLDGEALVGAVKLMPRRSDLLLNDLAVTLSARVVDHRRPPAESDPLAHGLGLAVNLNNLSNRLAHAGRYSEALAACEESVAIRRSLAEANPAAHEPNLATSLNNLSNHLSIAGRYSEALAACEESVAIRRPLAAFDLAAHGRALSSALNNLSIHLAEAGRHPEALKACEESVAIFRPLAETAPAEHKPELASSLVNLSLRLAEAGRHPEALKACEESLAIRRPLAQANPAAFAPDLAEGLNVLSLRLADAGRHPEALAASEESVAIRRLLVEASPAAFTRGLANSLGNLSNNLARAGRHPEALAAIEESVVIGRSLVLDNSGVHAADLAGSLGILARRLREAGHEDEAETAERGAAEQLERSGGR